MFSCLVVTERTNIHHLFDLPMDRPLLRRANAYIFPSDRKEVYLQNVHEGLSHSKGRHFDLTS